MRRNELERRIAEKRAEIALYKQGSRVRIFLERELSRLICERMRRDLRKPKRRAA